MQRSSGAQQPYRPDSSHAAADSTKPIPIPTPVAPAQPTPSDSTANCCAFLTGDRYLGRSRSGTQASNTYCRFRLRRAARA